MGSDRKSVRSVSPKPEKSPKRASVATPKVVEEAPVDVAPKSSRKSTAKKSERKSVSAPKVMEEAPVAAVSPKSSRKSTVKKSDRKSVRSVSPKPEKSPKRASVV